MKKIILVVLLFVFSVLPTPAGDTNKISNIYLRKFDIINNHNNNQVDYHYSGLKVFSSAEVSDSTINYYHDIGAKVTYYNDKKKKIGQKILRNLFFNGHFTFDIKTLPDNVNSYKISPVEAYNIDYYSYIKSRFSSAIFGLRLGYDMSDMFSSTYNTPEKLLDINSGILAAFNNFKQTYPNGYMLIDGTQIFFRDLNKSCKNFEKYGDELPSEYKTCAEVIIDINGPQLPNEQSTVDEIKDRFRILLYADSMVPYKNSVEEKIMNNTPINAVISSILKREMYYNYWKFIKNLEITDTSSGIEIIANNNSNDVQRAMIKVIFYNKLGEIVDSYDIQEWEFYPDYDDMFNIDRGGTPLDICFESNTLDKEISYFDIVITNK